MGIHFSPMCFGRSTCLLPCCSSNRPDRLGEHCSCVATGFVMGGYLLYFLVANPTVSRPIEQHIEYVSPHFFFVAAITLYLMSTTLSPLLSTHRTV